MAETRSSIQDSRAQADPVSDSHSTEKVRAPLSVDRAMPIETCLGDPGSCKAGGFYATPSSPGVKTSQTLDTQDTPEVTPAQPTNQKPER